MKIISFISQKGGSGKTTLAIHMAVVAQIARERVVLIDLDPQRSATIWGENRESDTPLVATATTDDLPKLIEIGEKEKMTLAVLDTAPHSNLAATAIARLSDLLIIPCRPSVLDLAAVESTIEIVKAAGKSAGFVLNACKSRGAEVEEARVYLESRGFPVLGEVTDRVMFARSLASGRTAYEYDSDPEHKAGKEMVAIWAAIRKKLKEQNDG